MVSSKLADLSTSELTYIETLLMTEFTKETERNKTWSTKNHYEKPFNKHQQVANCLVAIRSQKDLKRKISEKW
jgi:hypothetical protein|tara:strand:- start:97 stop:315 length:219 start_codon:yes stop_codon:yes gene_type:complete